MVVFAGISHWGDLGSLFMYRSSVARQIEVNGPRITRFERDEVVEIIESEDPLTWISDYQVRLGETPSWVVEELDLPKFTGGLVDYFGYDTIQYVEPRVAKRY